MKIVLLLLFLLFSFNSNCQIVFEDFNFKVSGIDTVGNLFSSKKLINGLNTISHSQLLKSDMILEIISFDQSQDNIQASISNILNYQTESINKMLIADFAQLYIDKSSNSQYLKIIRLKSGDKLAFMGELYKKFDSCLVKIFFISYDEKDLNRYILNLDNIELDSLD